MLGLDLHRRASLTKESGDRVRSGADLGMKELQSDALPELNVASEDDHAHSASAEDSLDEVLAGEHFAFGYRRGGFRWGYGRDRARWDDRA
jgi:hypothetical protein